MNRDPEIERAVAALYRGGVVAYPTEAVWGLGCDPFNESAVRRLLGIKQRPVSKGLILVAGDAAQLADLVDWPSLAPDRRAEVHASWPGPHTWIVPATTRVPRWITGDHTDVAVRVSAHPVVQALCAAFGGPLVSTSANPAGAEPPRDLADMAPSLRAAIDAIVEGATGAQDRPTPIRDARTGATLRV